MCVNTCETCGTVGCPHAYELTSRRPGFKSGLGHDLIPSLSELCHPKNNSEMK